MAINENTSVSPTSLCTITSRRVTRQNGTTVDLAVPYTATLVSGLNSYEITNTVDCPARLTLTKTVVNGDAVPTTWTLTATAPSGAIAGPTGATGVTKVVTPLVTYPLSENAADPRYVQLAGPNAVAIPGSTISWFCSQVNPTTGEVIPGFADGLNGGVTIPRGFAVSCDARNQTAPLTLIKIVQNTHGGTRVPSDWTLTATPTPPPAVPAGLLPQSVTGSVTGQTIYVRPGQPYVLSESSVPGYLQTDLSCVIGNETTPRAVETLTLEAGQNAACTFVNVDTPARLTLVKTVTNDNGGTAVPTAWTLAAAGPTPISGTTGSAAVTNSPVNAGTYTLSESGGPSGYTAGNWSCTAGTLTGSSLVLAPGVSATCTINNNDQPAHLTLVKTVTNDNGGTAVPTAWTLAAAGPTPISGTTGSTAVTNAPVNAGTYTLSESGGPNGYTAGDWSCTAGTLTGSSLVLPLNTSATCTINNNDQPAHLTLVKTVTNDNGGTAAADRVDAGCDRPDQHLRKHRQRGGDQRNGQLRHVHPRPSRAARTATQPAPGPARAGTLTGSSLVLGPGVSATCTINNNDQSAQLTLEKIVDPARIRVRQGARRLDVDRDPGQHSGPGDGVR